MNIASFSDRPHIKMISPPWTLPGSVTLECQVKQSYPGFTVRLLDPEGVELGRIDGALNGDGSYSGDIVFEVKHKRPTNVRANKFNYSCVVDWKRPKGIESMHKFGIVTLHCKLSRNQINNN